MHWQIFSMGLYSARSSAVAVKGVVGQQFSGSLRAGNFSLTAGFPVSTLVQGIPVSAGDLQARPSAFVLFQNFPNPFNPTTALRYELPTTSMVTLTVYDILGREVALLVKEKKNAGRYEVKFDAAGLSSGVYFYRIEAEDFVQVKKLHVIR